MSTTLAFVMDPIERVNIHTDTTFAFMAAAQKRGYELLYVRPHHIVLRGDNVFLRGRKVTVHENQAHHVDIQDETLLAADACRAIFIRTDPPFDESYLLATWLLSFAERQGVRVINSPRGVRSANEKLYALEFAHLCPETCVTSSRDDVRAFVNDHGGEAIAKPIDGHGGFGVLRLRRDDSNLNALVDMLTHEGSRPMLVQSYIPEAALRDKRLLLIDGELRGAVARVPSADDHRGNVHVGGTTQRCDIDDHDRTIANTMGARLREDGLFFVGLDVIGGKLIEVNVTSPTLVQETRALGGPDLAAEVIEAL